MPLKKELSENDKEKNKRTWKLKTKIAEREISTEVSKDNMKKFL